VVFTLNLVAAIPPNDTVAAALPVAGVLGIAGSIALLAITIAVIAAMRWRPEETGHPGAGPA
jgi:hypothetical protein